MPSEIKQLLVRIEDEQLAMRRGLVVELSSVARHDMIDHHQRNIDQAHLRLIELVGPQASQFVATTIELADLCYAAEQARKHIRETLQRYKISQVQTQQLPRVHVG